MGGTARWAVEQIGTENEREKGEGGEMIGWGVRRVCGKVGERRKYRNGNR